jgi:hypothetical protein
MFVMLALNSNPKLIAQIMEVVHGQQDQELLLDPALKQ